MTFFSAVLCLASKVFISVSCSLHALNLGLTRHRVVYPSSKQRLSYLMDLGLSPEAAEEGVNEVFGVSIAAAPLHSGESDPSLSRAAGNESHFNINQRRLRGDSRREASIENAPAPSPASAHGTSVTRQQPSVPLPRQESQYSRAPNLPPQQSTSTYQTRGSRGRSPTLAPPPRREYSPPLYNDYPQEHPKFEYTIFRNPNLAPPPQRPYSPPPVGYSVPIGLPPRRAYTANTGSESPTMDNEHFTPSREYVENLLAGAVARGVISPQMAEGLMRDAARLAYLNGDESALDL